jgi:hypothetical protein
MHINEFPEIKKGSKTIVAKTNPHQIIDDFTNQMANRNLTCLTFFTDKKDSTQKFPSGISMSKDFTPDDMLNIVLNYLNTSLDKKSRLLFTTQLQSWIVSGMINNLDENEEQEEDD